MTCFLGTTRSPRLPLLTTVKGREGNGREGRNPAGPSPSGPRIRQPHLSWWLFLERTCLETVSPWPANCLPRPTPPHPPRFSCVFFLRVPFGGQPPSRSRCQLCAPRAPGSRAPGWGAAPRAGCHAPAGGRTSGNGVAPGAPWLRLRGTFWNRNSPSHCGLHAIALC